MPIDVGQPAPDFTLKDQNNEDFTLSSCRGQRAVLAVFYPFAFTGICTGELCAIRDEKPIFAGDGIITVTISCDAPYAQKVFAERDKFDFPLLSDFWPHGAVAQRYGVFNAEGGFANRGTFLIDIDGIVRFAEMNGAGRGRDPQVWRDAIAELG
ncbi:MAG: peroxiredoxin [Actinomycetota bacterium]|nr:peroxiredoxin [Actinomycetota bacterium]